ncbi:MAG: trypsin-like peptidase domain-containing protein [Planctomycetaceae bacterium]
MLLRPLALGLCVCACLIASSAFASELRMTPAVKAIQKAMPSVVNIHTEKTAEDADSLSPAKDRKTNGMGTGILVDERGYIVTNFHVVSGVETLRATLSDGSNYTARVISYDKKHDLAIIKIDATKPLAVLPLGTSSDLMLGETVFAIGNAFGYPDTITQGLVSALHRDVEVNEKQGYKNLIQTDASINPGNSGGPLINLDGEVIGINVAIRAGAQRIGFAIPMDDARKIIAELLSGERLSQTFHGAILTDVKKGDQRFLRVDGAKSGSPAEQAGLKVGDIVTKVGAIPVTDATDFERACLGRLAGEKVEISFRRGSTSESATMTLATIGAGRRNIVEPTPAVARDQTEESAKDKAYRMMGIRIVPVAEAEKRQLGDKYRGGMKITEVKPLSTAAQNGIHTGDVLVGLHVWETVNFDNISFVLDHQQLPTFNPLKFYILRGNETLYGHLQVIPQTATKTR